MEKYCKHHFNSKTRGHFTKQQHLQNLNDMFWQLLYSTAPKSEHSFSVISLKLFISANPINMNMLNDVKYVQMKMAEGV